MFGLACLSFEQTQPGFGFAGFAGVFLLALAVWGMTFAPPSWLGLGVLLAGVGAMVLDVRMRRFGVATWAGIALFLAGSVLLYSGVAPVIRIAPWLIGATTVATFLFYGFGLTVATQSRDRIVSTQRGLIRPDRGGAWAAGAGRTRLREGALWRGRTLASRSIRGRRSACAASRAWCCGSRPTPTPVTSAKRCLPTIDA